MKNILCLLLISLSGFSFSQHAENEQQHENDTTEAVSDTFDFFKDSFSDAEDTPKPDDEAVEEFACMLTLETLPEFRNGGTDGVSEYVSQNLVYPETAVNDCIEGQVFVQFTVFRDGSVGDVKIVRGLRADLDEECVRVVESMPKWEKPGMQRNRPISVRYTLPIAFSLDANGKSKNIAPINSEVNEKKSKEKVPVIPEPQSGIEFRALPNPVTDILNIEVSNYSDDLKYQLFNMEGKMIMIGELNTAHEQVDLTGIQSGMYILWVISSERKLSETRQIIRN
ncbi:MAG: TonB family protein [Bacteroidales bacterium]|nr:TonB family protein [Bacteroidales bacterium]